MPSRTLITILCSPLILAACTTEQPQTTDDGPDMTDDTTPPSVAVSVVLNESDPTDEIEPGVILARNPDTVSGPLVGTNLEFTCGPCSEATFEDAVTQIGGGVEICGFTQQVTQGIITNGDRLCARNTLSGALIEIELLSWATAGECFDADETSCDAANGFTSYTRTTVSDGG